MCLWLVRTLDINPNQNFIRGTLKPLNCLISSGFWKRRPPLTRYSKYESMAAPIPASVAVNSPKIKNI
jgi:hypothetical protein